MTEAPTPTENSEKPRDNTTMSLKTSITQRLRTDRMEWTNEKVVMGHKKSWLTFN